MAALATGLTIDLGYSGGRADELRRATERRGELLRELVLVQSSQGREQQAARLLGAEDAAGLVAALDAGDPVSYVSRQIESSGLTRVEMRTAEVGAGGRIRRTNAFLRATGSYKQIHAFLAALERGPMLAIVQSFSIQQPLESRQLELRLDVSILQTAGSTP